MAGKTPQSSSSTPCEKRVVFTFDAPEAQSVIVTGTFCDWETQSLNLKMDKTGLWKTTLALPSGRYEYRFILDGEWRNDPRCSDLVSNEFGTANCVLHV